MNNKVRSFLIEIARNKRQGFIHYQELSNACELGLDMGIPKHRLEIGEILGEITCYENNYGRPLLSSLVITKNFEEGDGFFKLCVELGYGSNWKKLKEDPAFVSLRMIECHNFWQNEENYLKNK